MIWESCNHRGHKFPLFLTVFSFKTQIEWPPVLTATASFPSVFFQLLQFSRQYPSFLAHKAAIMTKADLAFLPFSLYLVLVDFAVQFCFHCKFSFCEKRFSSQAWSGGIFLDQLQLFASHNQWDCFILCYVTIGHIKWLFFMLAKVGKGWLLSYSERFWNRKALSVVKGVSF